MQFSATTDITSHDTLQCKFNGDDVVMTKYTQEVINEKLDVKKKSLQIDQSMGYCFLNAN